MSHERWIRVARVATSVEVDRARGLSEQLVDDDDQVSNLHDAAVTEHALVRRSAGKALDHRRDWIITALSDYRVG